MKDQMLAMLNLQEKMNRKIHPDWRSQNYEWYRAIWIESAELMDHQGWKWWKKQTPDHNQVLLELVDIWHFGLSDLLQGNSSIDELAEQIAGEFVVPETNKNFLLLVEKFAEQVLRSRQFEIAAFLPLLASSGLKFDQLFRHYIGKNVLNFFRQDHGYKSGSYRKIWAGREDNEHLSELVAQLDAGSKNFADDLYQALAERYAETEEAGVS